MTKFEYLLAVIKAKHNVCIKLLDEAKVLEEKAYNMTLKEAEEEYDEDSSI